MIVLPAIDLRDGACVQLVGGRYDAERVRLTDPLGVARRWADIGFRQLHVVDLDAATGRGTNASIMESIVAHTGLVAQVGGGLRSTEAVERMLAMGVARVVVGTRALEDPAWLTALACRHPHRVIVAADVRDRQIVIRGWDETLPLDIADVVSRLDAIPLAGLLVTAVHKEGQMLGPDLDLIEDVVRASRHPVHASGGIATMDDLHALCCRGVLAAVIGMALYTGTLDARAVAAEFAE